MQFQNHHLTLIHITVTKVRKTWYDFRTQGTKQDVPTSRPSQNRLVVFDRIFQIKTEWFEWFIRDSLLGFWLYRCWGRFVLDEFEIKVD